MMHLFTDGHIGERLQVEQLPFRIAAREMVIRVEEYKREQIRAERMKKPE